MVEDLFYVGAEGAWIEHRGLNIRIQERDIFCEDGRGRRWEDAAGRRVRQSEQAPH